MNTNEGCKQLGHHVGEKCGFTMWAIEGCSEEFCGRDAFHKVGSEDPTEFHNLTQYLCCSHYKKLMGRAAPCMVSE